MPKLTDREALKRIDWLLYNKADLLGRVTIRDKDRVSLRQVLRLAEIGLQVEETKQMILRMKPMEGSPCSDVVCSPRPLPGCGDDNLSD